MKPLDYAAPVVVALAENGDGARHLSCMTQRSRAEPALPTTEAFMPR